MKKKNENRVKKKCFKSIRKKKKHRSTKMEKVPKRIDITIMRECRSYLVSDIFSELL